MPMADQFDTGDRAELGVALNTRNYDALINNLSAARPPRRSSMPHVATTRSRATHSPPSYTSSYSLARASIQEEQEEGNNAGSAYDGVQDSTVVGVPVQTRNYVAMISGTDQRHSDAAFQYLDRATRSGNARSTAVAGAVDADTDNQKEDTDAVLGLPISTGNYVAYIAGNGQANPNGSGYSKLAASPVKSSGSRASAPALPPSKRRTSQPDRDSFPTAPTNGSCSPETRPSCFDNRRMSTAAAVYLSGWVLIQGSAFKTWKRYYAELSGIEFKYSKGVGQPAKGFGNVKAARRWNGLQFGILLEFADNTQLHIRCESETEYEQWMELLEKSIERNQTMNSQSKTSYTLTASEQHEGYLFRMDKNKAWRRSYFVVRIDGYIECRDRENGSVDRKASGYIKAVSFADNHANGLAIDIDNGTPIVCYADTYDEQMMWYAAIASAASTSTKTAPQPAATIKSTYVHTAVANHAGWLFKQTGLFKSWKRMYFTLHGLELACSKDTNSEVTVCDVAHSVEDWDGHPNGLQIRLKSGRSWKVHAESYESAKRWRSVISSACRHGDGFNMKKYLASRKRKKLPPVFGGWLTKIEKSSKLRQFYVIDGSTLGFANGIDNELQRLGTVVDVGASRDLDCGIVITLSSGMKIKAACDSLQSSRMWYECLNYSIT
jgi:hypothetical protein